MREYQLKYIRDLIFEYGTCSDTDPRRIDIIATITGFLRQEARPVSRFFSPPEPAAGSGVKIHHFFRHVITMVCNNPTKTARFMSDFSLTDLDVRRLVSAAAKRDRFAFNTIVGAITWPKTYDHLTIDLRDYDALAIKIALRLPVEFDLAWNPLTKVAYFAAHLANSEPTKFTQAWVDTCLGLIWYPSLELDTSARDAALTQTFVVAAPENLNIIKDFLDSPFAVRITQPYTDAANTQLTAEYSNNLIDVTPEMITMRAEELVRKDVRWFFNKFVASAKEFINSVSPRPTTTDAALKRAELTQLAEKIAANTASITDIHRIFDDVINRHDMQYFEQAEMYVTVSDLVKFLRPEREETASKKRSDFYRNLARLMPVQFVLDGVCEEPTTTGGNYGKAGRAGFEPA